MKPRYFKTSADFRAWLEAHGGSARELWVGFYKKTSGKGGLTYKDALDEALCFGWIDGVRKRVDEWGFVQRFTPRTASSLWSAVNLRRMKELLASGRVADVGRAVYERRDPKRTQLSSFENRPATFDAALTRRFKANADPWTFFRAQPRGYQKARTVWLLSAKTAARRVRRLDSLLAGREQGTRSTEA